MNHDQKTEVFFNRLKALNCFQDYQIERSGKYTSFYIEDSNRMSIVQFGDFFKCEVKMISCCVVFKVLANYIDNSQDYLNYSSSVTWGSHSRMTGHEFGRGIYEHLPLSWQDDESAGRLVELIEKYMRQDAEPFFDYWTDVRVFLPYIEGDYYDFSKMTDALGDLVMAKTVIWYQCAHPEYEDFVNFMIEKRKSRIVNEPDRRSGLEKTLPKLIALDKKLKESPPLYEWDPKYLIKKAFKV